jgi:superfamily II DNA/RNA helicase
MAEKDQHGKVAKIDNYVTLPAYPESGYGRIISIKGSTVTVLMHNGNIRYLTDASYSLVDPKDEGKIQRAIKREIRKLPKSQQPIKAIKVRLGIITEDGAEEAEEEEEEEEKKESSGGKRSKRSRRSKRRNKRTKRLNRK